MVWSLSFELMQGEDVLESSDDRPRPAVRSAYSIFLTPTRAIFRFDGFGSSLALSFFYHEIMDIAPTKRLFINYIILKTEKKQYFLNVSDPEYWTARIRELKASAALPLTSSPARRKKDLLDMLVVLNRHSLLDEVELEQKIARLDQMKLQ
jgi:hypothetical protein